MRTPSSALALIELVAVIAPLLKDSIETDCGVVIEDRARRHNEPLHAGGGENNRADRRRAVRRRASVLVLHQRLRDRHAAVHGAEPGCRLATFQVIPIARRGAAHESSGKSSTSSAGGGMGCLIALALTTTTLGTLLRSSRGAPDRETSSPRWCSRCGGAGKVFHSIHRHPTVHQIPSGLRSCFIALIALSMGPRYAFAMRPIPSTLERSADTRRQSTTTSARRGADRARPHVRLAEPFSASTFFLGTFAGQGSSWASPTRAGFRWRRRAEAAARSR